MVIEWIVAGGIVAAAALTGAGIGYYASKPRPYYFYPSNGYYQPAYYFTPRPVYYYSPWY
ncbi:hypothetical protein [[Eubacterium] cellulosolvens]